MQATMTLKAFFREVYVVTRQLGKVFGRSEATVEAYEDSIRLLDRYWRDGWPEAKPVLEADPAAAVRVCDLSNELLAGFMGYLASTPAGVAIGGRDLPTRNRHLRTLNCLWRLALKKRLTSLTPELEQVDENLDPPVAYTVDEFARLLTAAAKVRGYVGDVPGCLWWPALILMIFSTGVRISAIMHVEVGKLDFHNGRVFVPSSSQKQRKGQNFDLLPETLEVLGRMRLAQRVIRVFDDWPYDRTGRQWKTLNSRFRHIIAGAELNWEIKDPWHMLRRTFGTHVAKNAGEIVAQTLLGHSSIAVTRRYIDPNQVAGPSARDLLPRPAMPVQLRMFVG